MATSVFDAPPETQTPSRSVFAADVPQQPRSVFGAAPPAAAPRSVFSTSATPAEPPETATRVQTPTRNGVRANPLRQAAAALETGVEPLGALYGTRSGKPEFRQWWDLVKSFQFEEAQRLYSPFEDEQVLRYAKQNPDDPIAQILAKHPVARGIGTFIGEWANPAYWAGGKVAEGALRYGAMGLDAARTALPALDRSLTAAQAATTGPQGVVTHFAAPVAHAASQVTRPLAALADRGRAAAIASFLTAARLAGQGGQVAGDVGAAARSLFDRYYGLARRGGPAFEGAGLRAQSAADHAEGMVASRIFAAGRGLTRAQKIEVQKLMYTDPDGKLLHVPHTANTFNDIKIGTQVPFPDGTTKTVETVVKIGPHPDGTTTTRVKFKGDPQVHDFTPPVPTGPPVPEPRSGPSLAERAADMRALRAETDALLSQLGIRDTSKNPIGPTGLYFPMRMFDRPNGKIDPLTKRVEKVPVFQSQELTAAASRGETDLVHAFRGGGYGGKYSGKAQATGHKKDWDATILNPKIEADLHAQYDPFFQLERHYTDAHRAIANELERLSLRNLHVVDPQTGQLRTVAPLGEGPPAPARAREPIRYYLDTPSGRLVFGTGQEGKKARDLYIERQARGKGAQQARSDPAMQAFAQARGIAPSQLGTRGIVARGTLPDLARLQGAKNMARLYKNGLTRIVQNAASRDLRARRAAAGLAQRVARDVSFNADKLASVADANHQAAAQAARDARVLREAEEELNEELKAAQQAITPQQQLVAQLQRQMRDADLEHYGPIADQLKGGLRPSWVWHDGRWKIAGEYADIPKRYLNLRNRPTAPPADTQGLVARVESPDFDDVATQLGMADGDELRDWMIRHPEPPRLADYTDEAVRRVAASSQAGLDSANVQKLQKYAKFMRDEGAKARREAGERRFAAREFGPATEGVRGAAARAQQKLGDLANELAQPGVTFTAAAAKAAGLDAAAAKRQAILQQRLLSAAARAQTVKAFKKLAYDYYKKAYEEIGDRIREKSAHAPDGHYVIESTVPGLASPTRADMALDTSLADYFVGQQKLRAAEEPEAQAVWRAMQTLNRLSRMSIVLEPWVHGVNNEGIHYLAEGGLPETMAQILAGQYKPGRYDANGRFTPDASMAERAAKAGAWTERSERNFLGGTPGPNATTNIGERAQWAAAAASAKIGPLGRLAAPARAAQLHAGNVYKAMNHWLFGKVERDYAIDLFARKVAQGKSDAQAAFEVRNALGRNENLTSRELAMNLNKVFFFYPWMKTVVAYWARKGVIDPKWWAAPVRAIQANNEGQGYDDPSKPFTLTLGRRSDGQFRRYELPVPQRVMEPLANLARVPIDIGASALGKAPFTNALADAAAPFDYVVNHFNPALNLSADAFDALNAARQGQQPKPFSAFATDPYASPQEQLLGTLGRVAGKVAAPVGRVQEGAGDPLGAAGAFLTGGFSYGTKEAGAAALERRIRAKYEAHARAPFAKAIHGAQISGDGAALQRYEALVHARRAATKPYEDAAVRAALHATATP